MFTAQQKRKENIVEYILYLFQVEDLIRALKLNMPAIEKHLVAQYQADEKTRKEITNWYENLVLIMEKEGINEKGHFQFLKNQINELNELHLKLMNTSVNEEYVRYFKAASGLITELQLKGNSTNNDLQIGLDAVYGYLLLKIQKKEISAETTDAVKRLTHWLSMLSKLFKNYEVGELDFE
jgi:hypothetical protein